MGASAVRKMVAAAVLGAVVIATPASALLVQPVYLDMRYTGARANGGLRVVNDRNRPISVEVTVSSLEIPDRGAPVYTPIEGEDFLIFPAVANIAPNSTQIFRVRWLGESDGAESKLFALTTSELPIETEAEGRASLQLLYAIQTVVAIGPSNGRSDLSAVQAERATNDAGQAGVRVLFQNDGNLHGQVNTASVRVTSGEWSHALSPAEVAGAVGLGLVPSNGKRWMFLPIADVPPTGDLTVSADIPRAR